MSKPKWAVENRNLLTGESVRYMETHQEWVADLLCARANEHFRAADRPHESRVIRVA